METYLPWRFDTEFVLNIHIRIRYSNNYHRIALFVFVFVLIFRMNTIRIRIRFIFRKRILFVFVFVLKLLFVPTLYQNTIAFSSLNLKSAQERSFWTFLDVSGCDVRDMLSHINFDIPTSPDIRTFLILTHHSSISSYFNCRHMTFFKKICSLLKSEEFN